MAQCLYPAETACLLLEKPSIRLTSNSMLCAIFVLIALVTGPNSTWLRLVQFMPVTRAINCTRSQTINYACRCGFSFPTLFNTN